VRRNRQSRGHATPYYTDSNSNLRFAEKFTLRENKLLFHFVPRSFELERVLGALLCRNLSTGVALRPPLGG
jgi:hypothetical protein